MNMQEIRATAKEKLKGYCRVCPVCNGKACAGEVPGMGGAGSGESFAENVRALASRRLNMRVLHEATAANTAINLWGVELASPIMGAPLTGASFNMGPAMSEEGLAQAMHEGCAAAGTLSWSGDSADLSFYPIGLEYIKKQKGRGIPTIKPRSLPEIEKRIREAEEAGAFAVAVDVDAAGLFTMALKGQPVGPSRPADIAALAAGTSLPLILKGIMTVDEACLAASLGVKGIVVSNHGGRVLDCTPGSAEALPVIADAVRGKMKIFFDGGVRSGIDVLKALALGADAVLIGRPLVVAAAGGGAEGVALAMKGYADELKRAMPMVGVNCVTCVPRRILA